VTFKLGRHSQVGRDARSIISPQVRENYGLQIWLAFIRKPVRMSGRRTN
jgi:hypothetical protein